MGEAYPAVATRASPNAPSRHQLSLFTVSSNVSKPVRTPVAMRTSALRGEESNGRYVAVGLSWISDCPPTRNEAATFEYDTYHTTGSGRNQNSTEMLRTDIRRRRKYRKPAAIESTDWTRWWVRPWARRFIRKSRRWFPVEVASDAASQSPLPNSCH
ncbi:hypothetical protein HDV57DRAFT_12291 [Trichoderma longibrachiatum]|uniref:Uncharacterized protein n=1 Tax=Trichoderma longibrachiatum ATCC 18648 TaxID=983965 RepID=A0A2T4CJ82_TRILO|nr:hypothetical protein M440DRAFT_1020223 [Trichoderma longibrachiatum ATCC 18648]